MSVAPGLPPVDDAMFISQSVPSYMTAGQSYSVSVMMGNTGSSTWAMGGSYQLASQNPSSNTTWGPLPDGNQGKRNSVSPAVIVGVNSNAIFAFTITAPTTPGTYDFQWQMANVGSGTYQYFGEQTEDIAVTVGAAVPTRLTSAQAIQIAQVFCNTNNNPISVPGNAQYSVPDADDAYWQPRWTVTFNDQATVEVVDATGVVASYTNTAYTNYLIRMHGQLAGSLGSQATALQTAASALRATASIDQTGLPTAYMSRDNDGSHAGDSLWNVLYNRQSQSIPYKDDSVVILIDAATNQLVSLGLTYRCVPPDNGGSAAVVTQSQALATVQTDMIKLGVQPTSAMNAVLEVVLPNTYWQDGNYSFIPGQGKVAWVVSFSVGDPSAGGSYGVWVDVATGNVIGGEYVGEEKGKPTKHKSLTVRRKKITAKRSAGKKQKLHKAVE